MTPIVACALVFSLNAASAPSPKALPLQFKQVENAKNISQLLRSNADHCWTYNRDPRVLKDLANYIDAEGTISGDPHLGNMTVIPVHKLGGKGLLKFLNVDFDDGGQGPFALEIARYVTVAKASSSKIKTKDLLAAYRDGLNGNEMAKPKNIQRAEAITMKEYETLRAAFVAKKMANGKFKYTKGEIEKWEGRPNAADVISLFKDSKILDVAKRPQERGGSKSGTPRLWVLTQNNDGTYHITELKPYLETALAEYQSQMGPEARAKVLHETYWPGLEPKAYDLATIQGVRYWVREKKVEVLNYKNREEEDAARIYIANLIGLTQAAQSEGALLKHKIDKDPARFKDAIKQYFSDYLGIASETME